MRPRHNRLWWQSTVAEWQRSGTSAEVFVAKRGIHPATLVWWRRKLKLEAAEPTSGLTLLRVEVAEPAPEAAMLCAVVGPAELRFAAGTDPAYVGALVGAIVRAVQRC